MKKVRYYLCRDHRKKHVREAERVMSTVVPKGIAQLRDAEEVSRAACARTDDPIAKRFIREAVYGAVDWWWYAPYDREGLPARAQEKLYTKPRAALAVRAAAIRLGKHRDLEQSFRASGHLDREAFRALKRRSGLSWDDFEKAAAIACYSPYYER